MSENGAFAYHLFFIVVAIWGMAGKTNTFRSCSILNH